jgi:hypothetical protein
MVKDPCGGARTGWWVRVHNRDAPIKDVKRSGKWLLYVHCPYVRRVWSRVVADIRAGLLGPQAKVSTHKPSPLRKAAGQHVICVYTQSCEDTDDVLRVAKQLVETAELKRMRISYKSDAQTLAGDYSWNVADGIALHTFGPPYDALGRPKERDGAHEDVAPDGFCGGCRRPVRGRRRKCPSCGWLFLSDPFACLERDDVSPLQREAIELELRAVAATGPQEPSKSGELYKRRLHETLARLAARVRP